MLDIGLIDRNKSKGEIFILKRRYTLLEKQAKDKDPSLNLDGDQVYDFFIQCTKSILVDFFEERADDVTEGIINRWVDKHHELSVRKAGDMFKTLTNICNSRKRESLNEIKENLDLKHASKAQKLADDERERRIVAEASLSALQHELKEALDRIADYEIKEQKRLERKKKKIQKKRRAQVRHNICF